MTAVVGRDELHDLPDRELEAAERCGLDAVTRLVDAGHRRAAGVVESIVTETVLAERWRRQEVFAATWIDVEFNGHLADVELDPLPDGFTYHAVCTCGWRSEERRGAEAARAAQEHAAANGGGMWTPELEAVLHPGG